MERDVNVTIKYLLLKIVDEVHIKKILYTIMDKSTLNDFFKKREPRAYNTFYALFF